MSVITLENMEFHAYHGCLEHEKKLGNTFVVSVSMKMNTDKAEKSDLLEDTLNYQKVYNVVKEQIEIPANLIEHVGQRIVRSLEKQFPEVNSFVIKLSKLNPPLGGRVEKVTIELKSRKKCS